MNSHTQARWSFLLRVALLGALILTLLSAFSMAGFAALGAAVTSAPNENSVPKSWDIAKATVLLCPITFFWVGPFGFIVAGLGGLVFDIRRVNLRSLSRTLLGAVGVGFLAGFLFPIYDAAVNRQFRHSFSPSPWAEIFAAVVATSIICALVLRKRFLRSSFRPLRS